MIKTESEKSNENVCDLRYLTEMMGGKKNLIKEIIDEFIKQISEELHSLNEAIEKTDYAIIKNYTHTMKSTVSIVSISSLIPVLQEMEELGAKASGIEKLKELNQKLNLICTRAIEEIEREKHNYI